MEHSSPDGRSAPRRSGDDPALLVAEGVTKSYGGIRALRGADITLRAGEIHGLIGENGSGKSTLLGILSGQTLADSGEISLRGQRLAAGDQYTLRKNVAVVTQELSLAPDLTVAENILMSHDKPRRWWGIDWKRMNATASEALARLNVDIDPKVPVGRLRIDQQQLVEIAKAVQLDHPILILDEPTSSLTDDEVESLATTLRRLRDSGVAIVFVSHRLEEFFSLSDAVTVLRDGRRVASRPIAEYDRDTLVEDMLGYAVERFSHEALPGGAGSPALLTARNVCVPGHVDGVDLEVRAGEVVGLVGLEGAGRTELLEALFGARFQATGTVVAGGQSAMPSSPLKAMARGIALSPADRKQDGLMLEMSIGANLTMAASAGGNRLRAVRRQAEEQVAGAYIDALHLPPASSGRLVGSLSGGNQQKVLLAKWLETKPSVLLLDEPTRGVDVGAKREIHQLIANIRDEGVGVLCSSSDLEELMAIADRFVVMFHGRIVGELNREVATEARLSHLATGGAA